MQTKKNFIFRINSYIVGCKGRGEEYRERAWRELIVTQWDVKTVLQTGKVEFASELIVTQWDVK